MIDDIEASNVAGDQIAKLGNKLLDAKKALETIADRIRNDNIFNDVWWHSDCCTMLDYVESEIKKCQ